MSFLAPAVALRAHADNSWLNIMALNTAITDREVIGFTNQPWLRVYSGTGLYGSYFRDWWAVCQRGGLVVTKSWCRSQRSIWALLLARRKRMNRRWILQALCPKLALVKCYYSSRVKWTEILILLFFFSLVKLSLSLSLTLSFKKHFLWVYFVSVLCFCVKLLPSKIRYSVHIYFFLLFFHSQTNNISPESHRGRWWSMRVQVCVCVLARPGGRKSWGKSSSRLRTNTLQVLSHAFCACPNRSQGGRSIWRLIIVSKSRAAPTTCIFQAS